MPTRTISVAGGNWNAAGTWVGGVVPVANDDVLGLNTSGNVTINVSTANLQFVNFSNYLGTITLNNGFNIGSTQAATSTFSATMSFTTTSGYSDTNTVNISNSTSVGTHSIFTNGLKFPAFRVANATAKNVRLLDELNITTFYIPKGNNRTTFLGTYSIKCQNVIATSGIGGNVGQIQSSTNTLYFVGPTASWFNDNFTDPCAFGDINVVVDTTINGDGGAGTFSSRGILGFSGHTGTNEFTWVNGNLIGDKKLQIFSSIIDGIFNINQGVRLDVVNAGTWSEVYYQEYTTFNSPNTKKILRLDTDLKFNFMFSTPAWITPVSNGTLRRPFTILGGGGALKGGKFMALPFQGMNNALPVSQYAAPTFSTPIIELSSGVTHSFSDIHVFGYDQPLQIRNSNLQAAGLAWFKSTTNSVPATVVYTGSSNEVAFYTYFQDINASGGNPIYVYGGGASGSSNIATASFGSGQKSFTYVS